MAYDVDGTQVLVRRTSDNGKTTDDMNASAVAAMASTAQSAALIPYTQWGRLASLANVGTTSVWDCYLLFVFPVPTQLTGFFYVMAPVAQVGNAYQVTNVILEGSRDSTNGEDGTWFTIGTVPIGSKDTSAWPNANVLSAVDGSVQSTGLPTPAVSPTFRQDQAVTPGYGFTRLGGDTTRNLAMIRMRLVVSSNGNSSTPSGNWNVHLYGNPETSADSQRLEFWQVGYDLQATNVLTDWGDVQVGSTEDRSFRLKNMSAFKTASSITIRAEDLPGYPSPSPASEFLFSLDGITYTTSVTLGALGALSASAVIHVRRTTPSTAALSVWEPRIRVDVGGWV